MTQIDLQRKPHTVSAIEAVYLLVLLMFAVNKIARKLEDGHSIECIA